MYGYNSKQRFKELLQIYLKGCNQYKKDFVSNTLSWIKIYKK